jgi:hypothetical protein
VFNVHTFEFKINIAHTNNEKANAKTNVTKTYFKKHTRSLNFYREVFEIFDENQSGTLVEYA